MAHLFDIEVTGQNGVVYADRISADSLREAKSDLFGWWRERTVLGEPYALHNHTYSIYAVGRDGSQVERLWHETLQVYSTELTPEGEQAVIPGCERNAAPGAKQLDLF